MRRSFYLFSAIAILVLASACDGDDGDATPTATSPLSTESPVPTAAATPGRSPSAELPPIEIDVPELGAIVQVPFEISGTANVFEAALSVQILGADGALVCQHNIMATSGSGTRGDWSTVMAFPPPEPPSGSAAVPMVVRAFDYSAMDGSEENVVTVDINVSGERPPNVIESPACGAQASVATPLAVSGTTNAFEGLMQLELQDASGNVVASQRVQTVAEEDSPWTASLDLSVVTPGRYTLVAFDYSAADGSRQNDFPVPIEVAP